MASLFQKAVKSVGKALKKVAKPVLKVASSVASVIPVVGGVVSKGLDLVANALPDTKKQAIVEAVARDEVVKVDEIEKTIVAENPSMPAAQVVEATKQMARLASAAVPAATIDDSNSATNVPFMDKLKAFYGKYKALVIGGGVGIIGLIAFLVFGRKGKRRRR